jgi:Domain of unknown function (DUF4136)
MRKILCLPAVLLAVLVACSSMSVKHDYDQTNDFTKYKTYAWTEKQMPDDQLAKNPLVQKRVQAAVDATLASKGYTAVTQQEEADFIVVAHAGVKERMRIQDWGRYGWYDPWWGPYGGRVEVTYYEEGTLVIDIVDAKEKQLVWRGTGTGIVKQYQKPEKMQKDIDQDVVRILADFPPGK